MRGSLFWFKNPVHGWCRKVRPRVDDAHATTQGRDHHRRLHSVLFDPRMAEAQRGMCSHAGRQEYQRVVNRNEIRTDLESYHAYTCIWKRESEIRFSGSLTSICPGTLKLWLGQLFMGGSA